MRFESLKSRSRWAKRSVSEFYYSPMIENMMDLGALRVRIPGSESVSLRSSGIGGGGEVISRGIEVLEWSWQSRGDVDQREAR